MSHQKNWLDNLPANVVKPESSWISTASIHKTKSQECDIVKVNRKVATKYQNRLTEKAQHAPLHNRLAHQLRLAVHEGGSSDPLQNPKLKRVIKQAVQQEMSSHMINTTIRNCEQAEHETQKYLLQMRFQRKVFLVCSVRTECLDDVKRILSPILKKHSAGFVYAMHMFHSCGIVEAIVSYRAALDFSDLDRSIGRDAFACNAKSIEIVDYETGAVNFKCDPLELMDVAKAVTAKGYKVLHTEYGLRAKSLVDLLAKEREDYDKFLHRIRKLPGIESIYDNVRNASDEDQS